MEHFSRFSKEANASEFLENHEKNVSLFLIVVVHRDRTNDCINIVTTISRLQRVKRKMFTL